MRLIIALLLICSTAYAEGSYIVGDLGVIVPDMRGVYMSAPKEEDVIEVVAVETDTDKEVITKISLCNEDGEGCMELESK